MKEIFTFSYSHISTLVLYEQEIEMDINYPCNIGGGIYSGKNNGRWKEDGKGGC